MYDIKKLFNVTCLGETIEFTPIVCSYAIQTLKECSKTFNVKTITLEKAWKELEIEFNANLNNLTKQGIEDIKKVIAGNLTYVDYYFNEGQVLFDSIYPYNSNLVWVNIKNKAEQYYLQREIEIIKKIDKTKRIVTKELIMELMSTNFDNIKVAVASITIDLNNVLVKMRNINCLRFELLKQNVIPKNK